MTIGGSSAQNTDGTDDIIYHISNQFASLKHCWSVRTRVEFTMRWNVIAKNKYEATIMRLVCRRS